MTIYHFEFAKTGTGMSGGEKCMLELIQYLKSRGLKNILFTTDNGKDVYQRLGLVEDALLQYKTIPSYAYEQKHHIFISYISRTFAALRLVRSISPEDNDVIFCHSEFFPNSIPFYSFSRKARSAKLFYMFHMLAPSVWLGYEGQFTGKIQIPRPTIIHYRLNQWIYRLLTHPTGTIITINKYYEKILRKLYPHNRVYVIQRFGGEEPHPYPPEKKMDVIWMGRFHPQKGLLDLLEIAQRLKEEKGNVRIAVIGGGDKGVEEEFISQLAARNLQNSVQYLGQITSDERFRYLSSAKVFLMTSHYESFGLVILEALKYGVPVIAYDLPVYEVFKKGVIFVPLLHRDAMVYEIMRLLKDDTLREQLREDALRFSREFSWQETGREIFQLFCPSAQQKL